MGQMSLYVTFAPTMDDTIRTSLSKEVRVALQSHHTLFYQGMPFNNSALLAILTRSRHMI
jgi:hypothetical protein